MEFYVGVDIHQAKSLPRAIISANRFLRRNRKCGFEANDWILDSGAFSELVRHGRYVNSVEDYGAAVRKWSEYGNCVAAVSQDYMCTPTVLEKTKLSVRDHQTKTVERYLELLRLDLPVYLMPVLQGLTVQDYLDHVAMYKELVQKDAWIGIGSVFNMYQQMGTLTDILHAIAKAAPSWKLHGFGLKTTALKNSEVRSILHSADSYAWSYHARKNNRNQNSVQEASLFQQKIDALLSRPLVVQKRFF